MDAARVEELYRRHVPPARGLACALLGGDLHQAEDLVHDAFLRAASRLWTLRDDAAFGVYLNRSVVNAVISWSRRRSVERRWREAQPPVQSAPGVAGAVESDFEVLRRPQQTEFRRQFLAFFVRCGGRFVCRRREMNPQ